jgi:DNA (cytosine-5)-methyltransferase 3A
MNVLSLFDGMSCGRIALERLGIKVNNYYASEIDKYAMKVSEANYPDIIQVGDVTELDTSTLPNIDLVMGGSPCQGFSFAGKQLAFDDPRSALFFEFVRCVKELKPKYFLLENVRMKKEYLDIISEHMGVEPIMINSALVSAQNRVRYYWTNIPGVEQPEQRGMVLRDILENKEIDGLSEKAIAYMNRGSEKWSGGKTRAEHYIKHESKKSNCLTANMHKGVPYGVIAVDKTKLVDDLTDIPDKSQTIKAQYYKSSRANFENDRRKGGTFGATGIPQKPIQVGEAIDINGHDILKRVYSEDGKSPTLNACTGGNREPKVMVDKRKPNQINPSKKASGKQPYMQDRVFHVDGKSHALTREFASRTNVGDEQEVYWRKLTPIECERLQTVPDDYTNHVSNTQRYKMLGNGWTVDVIAHILQNMEINHREC